MTEPPKIAKSPVIEYRPGMTAEEAAHQIECELARMNGDPPPAPYRSYRWGYYFLAGALALVALRPFFERLLS